MERNAGVYQHMYTLLVTRISERRGQNVLDELKQEVASKKPQTTGLLVRTELHCDCGYRVGINH